MNVSFETICQMINDFQAACSSDDPLANSADDITGLDFLTFLAETMDKINMSRAGDALSDGAENFIPDAERNLEDIVRDFWNTYASYWQDAPRSYVSIMHPLSWRVIPDMDAKKQVFLSVGSGPGFYEIFLMKMYRRIGINSVKIYCVDFAEEMTRLSKKFLKAAKVSGVEFRTESALQLSASDSTIDQVLCINCLQWIPQWRQALKEIIRVLRPSGARKIHLIIDLNERITEPGVFKNTIAWFFDDLLDELESLDCFIASLSQIPGTGMGDLKIKNRAYIIAEWRPDDMREHSWRDVQMNFSNVIPTPRIR